MTYLIEYLVVFEFIFETVLDYVSGGLMGSFEAKNTESKISCLGTFKFAGTRYKILVQGGHYLVLPVQCTPVRTVVHI